MAQPAEAKKKAPPSLEEYAPPPPGTMQAGRGGSPYNDVEPVDELIDPLRLMESARRARGLRRLKGLFGGGE